MRSPGFCVWMGLTLIAVHVSVLLWTASHDSPTVDEVAHLPAGISHWKYGRFELYRVNPPLPRMIAACPVMVFASPRFDWSRFADFPGSRHEFAVGTDFIDANRGQVAHYFALARWACIPFSVLGAIVIWKWAAEIFHPWPALVPLVLWCFSPNIIAHAHLITPDIPATATGLAAAYVFWNWLASPTWGRALTCGAVLGLALLTKSTWILFFAMWPVFWLCIRIGVHPRLERRQWAREALQILANLGLGLLVLNAGYGFDGTGDALSTYRFVSRALAGMDDERPDQAVASIGGNRFAESGLGCLPLPFPRQYVLGIDTQKKDFEGGKVSYLRGEIRDRGWWYYYIYAFFIKEPIGFVALCAMAALMLMCHKLKGSYPALWYIFGHGACVFGFVSLQSDFTNHFRYVLPAFPFFFLLTGALANLGSSVKQFKSIAVSLALAQGIVSSSLAFPHYLSYFNELAGGPTKGHLHLLDSNVDWGQDLFYLRHWIASHPEAENLQVAAFNIYDPVLLQIGNGRPPKIPDAKVDLSKVDHAEFGPRAGWYAISVNLMHGYAVGGRRGDYYAYFSRFQPVDHVGHSLLIYHLDRESVNHVRQSIGLQPNP